MRIHQLPTESKAVFSWQLMKRAAWGRKIEASLSCDVKGRNYGVGAGGGDVVGDEFRTEQEAWWQAARMSCCRGGRGAGCDYRKHLAVCEFCTREVELAYKRIGGYVARSADRVRKC